MQISKNDQGILDKRNRLLSEMLAKKGLSQKSADKLKEFTRQELPSHGQLQSAEKTSEDKEIREQKEFGEKEKLGKQIQEDITVIKEQMPELKTEDKTLFTYDGKEEAAKKSIDAQKGINETDGVKLYGPKMREEANKLYELAENKHSDKFTQENIKKVSQEEGFEGEEIKPEDTQKLSSMAQKDIKSLLKSDNLLNKPLTEQNIAGKTSDIIKKIIRNYLDGDGEGSNKATGKETEVDDINRDPGKFLQEQKGQGKLNEQKTEKTGNKNKKKRLDVNVDVFFKPDIEAPDVAFKEKAIGQFTVDITGKDRNRVDKDKIRRECLRVRETETGEVIQIPDDGIFRADKTMEMLYVAPEKKLEKDDLITLHKNRPDEKPFDVYMKAKGQNDKLSAGLRYLEKHPEAPDAEEVKEEISDLNKPPDDSIRQSEN
ncbi:MAG TPA: hypothetical protein PL110_03450 [Candidatus Eremiobacteraeota bacterium]|nr:MAG: hypothetical protein BWY64_00930 [bacterium ADurb.Bin363]HPZ07144.1 hypothetical protein [Candidatus Eremiobacteraeota bacterium]